MGVSPPEPMEESGPSPRSPEPPAGVMDLVDAGQGPGASSVPQGAVPVLASSDDASAPPKAPEADAAAATVPPTDVADASMDGAATTSPAQDQPGASCPGHRPGPSHGTGGGPTSPKFKRLFVSAELSRGDLGGLDGADGRCQKAADAAKLGGRWKAFLSTQDETASKRWGSQGPWVEVGGSATVFADAAALRGNPAATITRNEWGVSRPGVFYWTGVAGRRGPGGMVATCKDWSSAESSTSGVQGVTGTLGQDWRRGLFESCATPAALLCLED